MAMFTEPGTLRAGGPVEVKARPEVSPNYDAVSPETAILLLAGVLLTGGLFWAYGLWLNIIALPALLVAGGTLGYLAFRAIRSVLWSVMFGHDAGPPPAADSSSPVERSMASVDTGLAEAALVLRDPPTG